MPKYFNYFLKNSVQLLLSSFLCSLVFINIVMETDYTIYLICLIFNIVAFLLYFVVLELKNKGWILYSVISLFYGVATYSVYDPYSESPLYVLLIVLYALSSLVFYFTVRLIRTPVITLILFIVFTHGIRNGILYTTNGFIITLLLYFSLYIVKGQSNINDEKYTFRKIKIISIFAITTVIIAMLIPIPKTPPNLPLISTFQSFLTDNGFEGSSISAFQTMKNNSNRNINEDIIEPNDTLIYTVSSDTPLYLRVKSYSSFENNSFKNEELLEKGRISNTSDKFGGFKQIYNMKYIISIDELNKLERLGLDFKKPLGSTSYEKSTVINSVNFPTSGLYLSTTNTKKISTQNKNNEIYYSPTGLVFDPKNDVEANEKYRIDYYSQELERGSFEEHLVNNMNEELIFEIYMLSSKYNLNEVFDYLRSPTSFNSSLQGREYKEIEKLTRNIIGDEKSLVKQCELITNYLKNGEFEYSYTINRVSPDKNFIYEFLFKSKKGYCVQFASAMTVMLQSLNIDARYAEGFFSDTKNIENPDIYDVTMRDAHSYVEVYIPGYGFKVFDPTPSRSVDKEVVTTGNSLITKISNLKVGEFSIQVILGLILLIIICITINKNRFKFKNKIFIYKLNKLTPKEGSICMIPYLIKELERQGYPILGGKTLREYEYTLKNLYNIDIKNFIDIYYKLKYEEGDISKDEYGNLINEFNKTINS
ncbi:MAG: transglutaminase domain-containing protein [Clostridium sp.]